MRPVEEFADVIAVTRLQHIVLLDEHWFTGGVSAKKSLVRTGNRALASQIMLDECL